MELQEESGKNNEMKIVWITKEDFLKLNMIVSP